MKKMLLMLLLLVTVSVGAFAQKGRFSVGAGASIATLECSLQPFIDVKCQYGVSDVFRLELMLTEQIASYGEEWADDLKTSVALGTNIYPFKFARVNPYFFVGVEYCHYTYYGYDYDIGGYEGNDDAFGGRFGLGVDIRLSYNWNLYAGGRYSTAMSDLYPNVGITYSF